MPQPINTRQIKLILHGLFLLSGTVTVLIGQILPILSRQFSLNDLEVGFYFPSQFAGTLFGTLLTSSFARKNQFIKASMIGAVLMALGVLLFNFGSFPISLAAFVIAGVGIGLTLPAINMTVLELAPLNSAAALSILNLCWGIGAIVCKPFVDYSSGGMDLSLTTTSLAIPLLLFAAFLFFQPTRFISMVASDPDDRDLIDPAIWRMPLAWAIAFFNFIHVGFESGMGGWLTTYTERIDDGSGVRWLSPTLLFFVLFVIGRGVAPVLFRFFKENTMLMLGLVIVLFGMLVTVTAAEVWVLGLGSAIAGFGTSWIFPTNVSRFSKAFGPTATRKAVPLFICGTLGAATSTWLIGFVSNRTGSLRSGMYVLVVSVVALIVVQIILSRHGRPSTAAKI